MHGDAVCTDGLGTGRCHARRVTHVSRCVTVDGRAKVGAYRFEQMVNNNTGFSVNARAMNFYWQHTPQARTAAACCPNPSSATRAAWNEARFRKPYPPCQKELLDVSSQQHVSGRPCPVGMNDPMVMCRGATLASTTNAYQAV